MGDTSILVRAIVRMASLALISFAALTARAQTPEADDRRAQISAEYRLPTNQVRFRDFLRDTFGPAAILQSAFVAGSHQLTDNPPEWQQGTEGYARRLASRFGRSGIQNSVGLVLGTVLRQDLRYQACNCKGLLRRTGHAVISNFTARTSDGGRTFTPARIAGSYGGAILSLAWYPDRYTAAGDGVRMGSLSVASGSLLNIAREFWPEVRRILHR